MYLIAANHWMVVMAQAAAAVKADNTKYKYAYRLKSEILLSLLLFCNFCICFFFIKELKFCQFGLNVNFNSLSLCFSMVSGSWLMSFELNFQFSLRWFYIRVFVAVEYLVLIITIVVINEYKKLINY